MGGLLIIGGIVYIVVQLIEDASLHQVPKGTDARQAVIDASQNNLSKRQLRKNLMSGKYVRK